MPARPSSFRWSTSPVRTRREMIVDAVRLAGGVLGAPALLLRAAAPVQATVTVETSAGRVRGSILPGGCEFRGLVYGASTRGTARYLPPQPPVPWSGVRDALEYGAVCPQLAGHRYLRDPLTARLLEPLYGLPDEDCLRLNVWTPAVGDGARRPVLVWIHGGGCSAWSGQYLSAFHGGNLSRRHDAVVVAVTHRLGPLGFLQLAELGGPDYAAAGNAGMLDLVAALRWVREHAAAFGGDPGRVTLFGQSGGGAKIAALLAMPAARGLFQAALLSGTTGAAQSPEAAARLAAAIRAELGGGCGVETLVRAPVEDLLAASERVLDRLAPPAARPGGFYPVPAAPAWGPVVDGAVLPEDPFATGAPAAAAGVPVIIGTVLHECMPDFFTAEREAMGWDDVRRLIQPVCGGRARELMDAARAVVPDENPAGLLAVLYSTYVRRVAQRWTARKAAQDPAGGFSYWFTWHTPVEGGRPRAFHCLDIPFLFDNADRCAAMTGGTKEARGLAAAVAGSLVAFACTGLPVHAGLPRWDPFEVRRGNTLCIDRNPRLLDDPDRELRRLFGEIVGTYPGLAA